MELQRFFDRAVCASFRDLALDDEPAARYLADLLTRFARTEHLFPPGVLVPRLETVVDCLLEAQAAWQEPTWQPEREVSVRRHIGEIFANWPDLRFRGRRLYARDGLVVSEWTATATHGDGRRLEWDGIDVFPFENGLIARKDD